MSYRDFSDEEMVETIVEQFKEDGRVNTDFIQVDCSKGKPILSGRVASDKDLQIIDEIMNDVLDIHIYDNTVWVDDTLAFEEGSEEGDRGLYEEEEEEEELKESFEDEEDQGDDEE